MTGTFLHCDATGERYAHAKTKWCEPFDYQERHSGKRVRIELTLALSRIYGLHSSQVQVLCNAIERMNTASLIHDDLVDGDRTRRGAPTVWIKYGASAALISGMYGYLDGLEELAELNNMNVILAALKSLEALHIGQYYDVQASDAHTLPTLDEYRFIAQANTGCFFVFILDACQCLNPLADGLYRCLKNLLLELAVYYRLINDYVDVNDISHFREKGFAADLEGGPKSFLMILANTPLVKGKRTDEQKKRIIQDFGRAGVFDRALNLMDDSYEGIQQYLSQVRQQCSLHNVTLLQNLLHKIHFQPDPQNNYYQQLTS